MNKKNFLFIFLIIIVSIGFFKFFDNLFVHGQYAVIDYVNPRYCESIPRPPEVCYNGAIPGYPTDCGPACPLDYYPTYWGGYSYGYGQSWTKYTKTWRCVEFATYEGGITYFWEKSFGPAQSTGDKLEAYCQNSICGYIKDGYLAAGSCNPGESGGYYKVCCGPGGRVEPSEKSWNELDIINPPTEGRCPSDPYGVNPTYTSNTSPNVGEIHPACGGGGGGGGGGAPPSPPLSCPNGGCFSSGSKICVDLGRYKECRWDPAVRGYCWSDPISCPPRQMCQNNQCVPKQEIVRTETCNFQGTFSASPTSGNLADRFDITYGVTKSGTCGTCSGTLYVTLKLDKIDQKCKPRSPNLTISSTTIQVDKGNIIGNGRYIFTPEYHGNHKFSVNVNGNVSCDDLPEQETDTQIIKTKVTYQFLSTNKEVLVNPTDVTPLNPTVTSSPPTPPSGTYKTALRQFIAGFQHIITYGVRLSSPFVFKLDDGRAIGSMTGPQSFSASFPLQNTSGSSPITKTATFTPILAGQYTISSCHNADDESICNEECGRRITITVYRYLCYQGFCFECPKEPQLRGVYLDVKGAGCQVVEDVKCKTYIKKSCTAGVRE
jgi:hypothetical protein